MARRKTMIVGRSGEAWFSTALGFCDPRAFNETFGATSYEAQLNFERIERRAGHRIPEAARGEISKAFSQFCFWKFESLVTERSDTWSETFGYPTMGEMPETDFKKLIGSICKKARELTQLVDVLVEFDPGLACRPQNTRDDDSYGSRLARTVDRISGCSEPAHQLSAQDFSEYISFRSTLDYLANFDGINERFNNWYSVRYSRETDHSDFDLLIRRVVLILRRHGFPMTITVPTDSLPEYESPVLSVLLEIQNSWNCHFVAPEGHEKPAVIEYNYRQLAYLVSQVLKDMAQWDDVLLDVARS